MNTHVFGGQGKTTLLVADALAEIEAGGGVIFVDPHGGAIDALLSLFPKRRTADVLLIDPTDIDRPVGFNVLDNVPNKPLAASIYAQTVKAIWNYLDVPTPVMDRMTYNVIAALLEYPGATLLDVDRMLTDAAFRERVLKHVQDPVLLRKWRYWSRKKEKDWDALIQSTENKSGEFTEDPRIRHVIGQSRSTFDLKRLLFERKIVLVRLPTGQLGQKTTMFGSLFLAYVQQVVYSRRIQMPVSIYIDDCQHFDTPVLRQLLASGRRYNLSLTLANQYLAQVGPDLRSALIGNCERRIMFRTGIEDSEYLHRTIPQDNTVPKLHQLARFEAMAFDGTSTMRIETRKTPKLPIGKRARAIAVASQSRRKYGREVGRVETRIRRSMEG